MESSTLLTRQQAAEYLGVRAQTLAAWASSKRYGLPMIRVGRSIRYRRADLDRWLDARTVGSSAEEK
jgi:excisionase family DNA binding protein